MPITIRPAPHGANEFSSSAKPADNSWQLLKRTCPKESRRVKDQQIIQSSFEKLVPESNVHSSKNGFVDGAVAAYCDHQHLVIRPDDVWITILSQFSIYVNENSEKLRDHFVAHEGKKSLDIDGHDKDIQGKSKFGNFTVDWGKFTYKMTQMISNNVKDPTLKDWILPSFTTTTKVDQAVASIMMMATLQKYFDYSCSIMCGLPSVTLLGSKSDWEDIAKRAERLTSFGEEPTQWSELLKPVLARFVKSFDDPDSEETRDFWQRIAHKQNMGSGPTYLSGWITAFCFWDTDGKPLFEAERIPKRSLERVESGKTNPTHWDGSPLLQLDEARYHIVDISKIPSAWATVPVTLDDDGLITNCAMVAGSVGFKVSSSGLDLHELDGKRGLDTISPELGWWMYVTKSDEIIKAEKRARVRNFKEKYRIKRDYGSDYGSELGSDFDDD